MCDSPHLCSSRPAWRSYPASFLTWTCAVQASCPHSHLLFPRMLTAQAARVAHVCSGCARRAGSVSVCWPRTAASLSPEGVASLLAQQLQSSSGQTNRRTSLRRSAPNLGKRSPFQTGPSLGTLPALRATCSLTNILQLLFGHSLIILNVKLPLFKSRWFLPLDWA